MTARRLRTGASDARDPVAIPGIPAPLHGAGLASSLAQVLTIALDRIGPALGYDVVMGLTGLAFCTPPWPEPPEPSPEEEAGALEALSGTLGNSLTLMHKPSETDASAVMERVREAVDAGRPCIAHGWGSAKDRWAIICGYDTGRNRLLGHCLLEVPREQYESWPPAMEMLGVFASSPTPGGPEAIQHALRVGVERWLSEGRDRLERWAESISGAEEPPGAAHETAVELLADARAAAAGFVERVARFEEEGPAAWLARAAELWREGVSALESRGVPHSPEAIALLEDAEGRAAWAELLNYVARVDEAAFEAVRRSMTADYLPEDDAPDW